MNALTLEQIKDKTLEQVRTLYQQGRIEQSTAEAYVELWNTSTFRFTYAKVTGQTIQQFMHEDIVWR